MLKANGELIQPVDYVSTDTISRPHRRTNYLFDEPTGHVTGEYKSDPVDVPMRSGGQNRISAHIAVMRALQSDAELSEISIFDRRRWKDYRFEVVRGQTVKTSSGTFDTVAVSYTSPNDNKRWLLHCADALNYLPVLIVYSENGKTKSRAELVDYRLDD